MPIFDYKCEHCKTQFEEFVKHYDDEVKCPKCNEIAVRNYNGNIYGGAGKTKQNCTGNCKTCSGCH